MAEECKICGRTFQLLNENHLRTHNKTLDQYREEFGYPGGGKEVIKKISKKLNSKKTPANTSYQSARTLEEIYKLNETIKVPDKFIRVTEANQHLLQEISELANRYKSVSIDTETTGLNPFYDIITDFIITINEEPSYNHNYHIPMLHVDRENKLIPGQLPVVLVRDWARSILESEEIEKTFHTALFDCMMLQEVWGIETKNIAFDVYVAAKLLNENDKSHKLKDLYRQYLLEYEDDEEIKKLGVETYEEQFGKIQFFRVPMNVATCYAAKDGYMTRALREFQQPHIDSIGRLAEIFRVIELPLIPLLLKMRREGIQLDLDTAAELDQILAREVVETNLRLREIIGDININSPKQLSHKLYEELKLPNLYKGSTKREAMEDLSDMGYEVPNLILTFRGKEKLRSTYTTPAATYIQAKTGKVHTYFNPMGTVTGRFSSNNPNLQNLPSRKDKRIRTMFTVEPGSVFISCDFSQIEPRILAHLSQDPVMLLAYQNNEDIYASMAAAIYSEIEGRTITPEDCGDGTAYRTNMKTILLGIMYNMSEIGLARKLRIDKHRARDIIDSFYSRFKGVATYERELKRFCKAEGFVETVHGRKRRLPGIWDEQFWLRAKTERQVLNASIQGTAADIIKLAMLKVGYDPELQELGGQMLLTVHDEIASKGPVERGLDIARRIITCMIDVWDLTVPISVDAEVYYDRRWYGKKVDLVKEDNVWVVRHGKDIITDDDFKRLYQSHN